MTSETEKKNDDKVRGLIALSTETVRTPWPFITNGPTASSYVVYLESAVIERLPAR